MTAGNFEASTSSAVIDRRYSLVVACRGMPIITSSPTRRDFMKITLLLVPSWLRAQAAPASGGIPSRESIEDLVAANRILAAQNVVDAYGHVSVRHDRVPNRYLLARSMAPALVSADDIIEFDLDSNPVDAKGRTLYGERFIHGEIYKARPEVKAVVHSHTPALIPFGITGVPLRPVYHMSSFIAEGVPVFESRNSGVRDARIQIETAEMGGALAKTLGTHPAVLMRGHGGVVVGPSLPDAVMRAVYLQMNAQLQSEAMSLGGGNVTYLNSEEARTVNLNSDRAWDLWKRQVLGK
jgi:ribulose-5-phosphate 4-epimerase/fuculose-1-phosphate aldolase